MGLYTRAKHCLFYHMIAVCIKEFPWKLPTCSVKNAYVLLAHLLTESIIDAALCSTLLLHGKPKRSTKILVIKQYREIAVAYATENRNMLGWLCSRFVLTLRGVVNQ